MTLRALSTLSFLFYGSGDHRDLHSFPTRRSSDLAPDSHRSLQAQAPSCRYRARGLRLERGCSGRAAVRARAPRLDRGGEEARSEEHTSELQSRLHLVCRLLLEKKKKTQSNKL